MTLIKSFETLNLNGLTHDDLLDVVQAATQYAQEQLQQFAQTADFSDKIVQSFGISPAGLQAAWANGVVILPEIEIISSSQINGASGAFAGATNKIYLAQEFLSANANNLDAVVGVLLEEYGHFVDYSVNATDSPGDEGAIFSALVRGESLSTDKLSQLKIEDDKSLVVLNGSVVEIEKSSSSIISFEGSFLPQDYDNDGDLDFLFTGFGTTADFKIQHVVRIYRHDNNGFSEPIVEFNSNILGWNLESADWIDYDNDKDLDLLLNGKKGTAPIVQLYTNNNGTYSLTPLDEISVPKPPEFDSFEGSFLPQDYDNDGDLDFLFTGFGTTADFKIQHVVRIYRHDNNGFSEPIVEFNSNTLGWNLESAYWIDYDNDKDLDLLLNGKKGTAPIVQLYTNNNGTYSLTPLDEISVPKPPEFDSFEGSFLPQDYDNDGDLDFLFTGFGTTADFKIQHVVRIYRHDNNGFSEPIVEFNSNTLGWNLESAYWIDYDNDKDLDLLLNGKKGTAPIVQLYTNNNGTYSLTPLDEISVPKPPEFDSFEGSFLPQDYDNDGDLDFLFTGFGTTADFKIQHVVRIYRHDNNGFSEPIVEFNSNTLGWNLESAYWIDYDNDKDLDLLLNGKKGTAPIVQLYTNNNGTYSLTLLDEISVPKPPEFDSFEGSFLPQDYDNDGDLDFLFTGFGTTADFKSQHVVRIYRHDNNGFSEPIAEFNSNTLGWNLESAYWIDYDNDKDLDLLLNGKKGTDPIVQLYTNNNGTYSLTPFDEISVAVSDIFPSTPCTVSINDVAVTEGNLATFTVTFEGDNTQPVTVNYSTSNNTATAGLDYESTSGILTFNPGEKTKTITVKTLTDSPTELDETFFVNLTTTNANIDITDAQGVGTIQDISYQSNPGILSFSRSEFRVNENGQAVTAVTVTRSGGNNGIVSGTITLSNGTATAPGDYNNTPITVTFASGDTTSKIIQIPIVDDSIVESSETINLALTNPTGGATIGSQKTASLVIVDNDSKLTSATPDIYEFLAKDVAYKDWQINQLISFSGFNYIVDSVFKNDTGFYALGLTSETLEPVLVLRGTEPTANFLADIFADTEPEGIGFNQFSSARNEINQWLGKYDRPNIIGHSLGGALAQFFAADFTSRAENQGKVLGDIFTFNSPGISKEWANKFDPTKAGEVKHDIVSGDLVSLGGDDYIDGKYEIFSYPTGNNLDKHLNFFLASGISYNTPDSTPITKPANITSQLFDSVDSLNNDYFSYAYTDKYFFNFLLGALILTSSFPETQRLVSSLLFRGSTEKTRQEIGKQLIPIIDELGLTDDKNTGGSVKLPDVNFKILNLLDVEATDLGAIYVEQPDKFLKLQGIVSIPTIYNVTGNFANDNFIKLAYDAKNNLDVDLVGSISLENILIVPNVWELKRASLYLDTIKNEIKGDGSVLIPTGIVIGGGIGFINGEFNYLSLEADQLNRPLGLTGAFLQHIKGQIDNVAPSDPDPIGFTGKLGFTAGPKIEISVPSWLAGGTNFSGSLLDLDLTGSLNINQIQGNGNVKLLGGLATGQGDATLNWNQHFFDANLNISIGDIINGQGQLKANYNFDFGLGFGANVKAPQVDFEIDTFAFGKKKINLGGQQLASGNAVIEFTNDNNLSNDFIRSSGQIDVPIIGKQDAAFTVFLNGRAQIKIGEFLQEINPTFRTNSSSNLARTFSLASVVEQTNTYQIDPDTKWAIFNTNWDTPSDNVKIQLQKPDGTILQESDFANSSDISLINTLSGSTTRAVVVANPESGIWHINVVDSTALGDVQSSAFRDSEGPVIQLNSISPNTDASEITINYTAIDPDSEAQISLFYDNDGVGNDGILIAGGIQEADSTDIFKWNTQGVAPGTYHVYAMALDENHVPVFTYAPTSVEITAQADLVITKTASADSVQIGDRLTYTITITNNGTIESQGINLTETLAEGVTFVSASLTPTTQSEGTLNFNLGNLASSTATTVEITVTAPSTTGVISSRSQIASHTFDPNANNDFVILDTTVVEEAVANNSPVATDDIATTQEDTSVVINVLNNDSDVENNLDVTTVQVATNPNNGTVTVNSNTGEITYTPTTNFSGNDSFTYTVKDSSGATSNAATVNIIVNSVASEVANFNNSQVFNLGGKAGKTRQLQLSFVSQNTNFVNEIGFFIADDDQGTINGITPDNPNYLTTSLTNSQVIFSALPNNVLQGVDFTRQLNLPGSARLVFYLVQNSTTETVLTDLIAGKKPANVLFAIPSANSNSFDPLQVSQLDNEAFTLSWKDTLNGNDNAFNDLILNVQVANETSTPLGTAQQGNIELIDLRNLGTLEASFKVASEAAYNNTVGWYLVDDETGRIGNLKPGDAGYAQAAIAGRSVTNFTRDGIDSAQLQGLLAPYLIANSSRESFLANNPNNTVGNGSLAYFAFMGANADGVDHVRQLGDNTFGFEDLFNGGDKDYNDIILQVNFA